MEFQSSVSYFTYKSLPLDFEQPSCLAARMPRHNCTGRKIGFLD